MPIRPRRSALYMPGSNARALDKARTAPADVVIIDLEDAVAPDAKASARERACAEVKGGGFGFREVVIRINGLQSAWGAEDVAAVAAAGPHAILIPKVSTPGDVMMVAAEMKKADAPERMRVWAMIETPAAILNIHSITRASGDPASRLETLVMGVNDLARETRARLTKGRAGLVPWLAMCVAAARAHGLDLLDGVYGDLRDLEGLRAECAQGRDMGMDGKTLVHPNQIAICNEVFSPDAVEVAAARAILAAFEKPENAGKGAIALDGRMVERLHAEMARRTLAMADAVAQRGA